MFLQNCIVGPWEWYDIIFLINWSMVYWSNLSVRSIVMHQLAQIQADKLAGSKSIKIIWSQCGLNACEKLYGLADLYQSSFYLYKDIVLFEQINELFYCNLWDMFQLAGWGRSTDSLQDDQTLEWTYQKYIGYEECREIMTPSDRKFLSADKFCADGVKG